MDMNTVFFVLAVIVLIIGVALALFGRAIWDMLMSMIGGMIGWMIGFGIGIWFFGYDSWTGIIIAIILGFVGSFIMGALFGVLVDVALALLAGLLVGALVFFATEDWLYAGIALLVVTILAYVFIERIISIVTAFIGAILAAAAIWYLAGANLAILGFVLLFVIGAAIQHFMLDIHDPNH